MEGSTLVYGARIGLGFVALILIGSMLRRAHAYLSWRAYGYYGLSVILFPLIAFVRFSWFGLPENMVVRQVLELLFILGLAGTLWEHFRADQHRYQDSMRLAEQWRASSHLAEKRARHMEVLSTVTSKLVASLDLHQVVQTVAYEALALVRADSVTVYLRGSENGDLNLPGVTAQAAAAQQARPPHAPPPPRSDGLTAVVVRSGEAVFINEAQQHPLYQGGIDPDLLAIASLPLRLEGKVLGVMNVCYHRPHEFDEDEVRLLSALADTSALAIHNAGLHERITQVAVTDDLTGLANRRRFLAGLRAEVQRARRYGRALALLMIDLDWLKEINDAHGHAAGDAMLRVVAQSLRQNVRETDLAARLSGDEFAVLLPETDGEAARAIAERIRASVAECRLPVGAEGAEISSTVSIGVVSLAAGRLPDLPSFLHLADEALYRAKTGGRNTVVVASAGMGNLRIDEPAETC